MFDYVERDYGQPDGRTDEVFTLYVSHLPEELNEDGIARIFQKYGEMTIISPPRAGWAFISYKNYRHAEHALRSLNDASPLYLKVAFRKKKEPQKLHNYDANVAGPLQDGFVRDFRYADNGILPNGSCGNFMPGGLGSNFARFANYNNEIDVNSVYPSDLDHNIYDPYETPGRYADTNAMWSRGCMNVDLHGKRYVSMGRGSTRFHIPEPHPNLEQQITTLYESRRAGLYEFGEDRMKARIGNCQLCTRVSNLTCQYCAVYYCSKQCQRDDWPRHKKECAPIPALVGAGDPAPITRSSSDDQLHVPRKPGGMDLRALGTLRRPKTGARTTEAKNADCEKLDQREAAAEPTVNIISAPLGELMIGGSATKKKPFPTDFDGSQPLQRHNFTANSDENREISKPSNNAGRTPNNRNDVAHRQNENRRHDENLDDRRRSNNGHGYGFGNSQNGRLNDQTKTHQNRGNNRSFEKLENFRSSGGGFNNAGAMSKQTHNNVSQSETMSEQTKLELMKMDEDLAFNRETRDPTNVDRTASVGVSSSHLRPENFVPTITTETRISKTDFTDVIVVHPMSDGTFWVHRTLDRPTIEQMMQELQTKAPCYPVATELVVGEMYATKYDGYWHRVVFRSKNSGTVFYVDYGNDDPPQSEEFRSMTDFPKYPPAAMRMRLAARVGGNSRNVADGDRLSVKMMRVDGEGVVEVVDDGGNTAIVNELLKTPKKPETPVKISVAKAATPTVEASSLSPSKAPEIATAVSKAATIEEKSSVAIPSSVDGLETSGTGYIQVFMALNNNSYAVCVLRPELTEQYRMVYEILTEVCDGTADVANFKPQIGDFVCGKRDDGWLRGYVFSFGPPMRLTLVDEARVSTVERVVPMPKDFEKICSFGSICSFAKPGHNFEIDETAEFTVTGIETSGGERVITAVLNSPERLKNVGVTLKNWSPTPEQKGVGFADLKTNSQVCITAYTSERIMFVRSFDENSSERTRVVTQNVAKWALKAPMLDGPPAVGQLVIAKFTDGNFYRAIVTKLQDGKIGVSYVDYGNRDFVTIADLRILSDELKNERSCVAKIVLKDIKTDVPPTQDVHQYLSRLVGKEEPLVCTFDGIPSKDGVVLKTATGECVNDKVNEYLTPSWQREDPAKNTECFTMVHLEYAKLGEVGQTTKALVLYASEEPLRYWMCPFDSQHITHVTAVMPELLEAYCNSTKTHYIPRTSELCLAVFEGSWYRGLCLNPSSTPTQAIIHFIDFGNTDNVNHTDIREITKDFMSPPALGCICEIKNLGVEAINGEIPTKIKERLAALIPCNDFVDIKIIKKLGDGDYEVEVPQVRQKLVEEGLVSSH